MGIPLWLSPPKGLDPDSASSRTNARHNHNLDSTTVSQEPFSSSSSSTSSSASSASLLNAPTTQQRSNSNNSSNSSSSSGNNNNNNNNNNTNNRSWPDIGDGLGLLTLGEFLRETAPGDDNDRQLNGILRLRRRMVAAEYNSGNDRSRTGDYLFVPAPLPPPPPPPPPPANWNYSGLGNLFDHTPAGRARILSTLGSAAIGGSRSTGGSGSGGAGGASAAPATSAPPTSSSSSTASTSVASMSAAAIARDQTTFANLVGQIRRIGELQDFVLSSADEANNPENPDRTAAEGETRIASALGNRESRLRAMQTRIDLLASEFQLLRNTRRELRRVEEEALETLQNSSSTTGSSRGTRSVPAIPVAQPTSSSPRGHSGRREPRALMIQRFRRSRAEGRLPDLSDDEADSHEYPPVFTNLTSTVGHTGRHRNPTLARNPGFRLDQGNPSWTQTHDVDSQRQEAAAATDAADTEAAEQTEREDEGESDYIIPSTEVRDHILFDIVMRMQIESLQGGGLPGL
ncbi:hypothetical protein L873DRAFT_1826103 [Choiromyces venosus 120613-1]|uniref:Uncharacterized protein n=1 Tax=Choiromyces venosus 120613-1 TaxID=1336337 RepID=A0A3N4K0T5_9PEZI|nr:hypothetical protein L873DRAFT_1826103 [Choiromyces venosus 120613-1]